MNLPRFSLRYPVTAGMVIVSIVVLGAISAPRLPLAFLPEVDFPSLEISIPYPNALPAQVEEEIARPAEEALATLSRVRRIETQCSSNSAEITVQFDWGEDIAPLRVEAREKLDRIRDQLPADVDRIQINSFRSSDIPVLECRLSASRDLSRDYELLNRHVADPLRRVPGVAKGRALRRRAPRGADRPQARGPRTPRHRRPDAARTARGRQPHRQRRRAGARPRDLAAARREPVLEPRRAAAVPDRRARA